MGLGADTPAPGAARRPRPAAPPAARVELYTLREKGAERHSRRGLEMTKSDRRRGGEAEKDPGRTGGGGSERPPLLAPAASSPVVKRVPRA